MKLEILKFRVKSFFPFLRIRWPNLTKVLSHWANTCAREFSFTDENGQLVACHSNGLKLYGFGNTHREEKLIIMLQKDALFQSLDKKYFRLLTDIICRYKFSHLRPDLCPLVTSDPDPDVNYMEGFHGQHRDTILHINDISLKNKLSKEFSPKDDDVILDCGSFLGFGALALSPLLKNGKIIAIEASQNCYDILKKNIKHNKIKNVDFIKGAIWSKESKKMYLSTSGVQANSLISNIVKENNADKIRKETVECFSVDSIVKNKKLKKVDMISLTLNGAEVEALLGAKLTLSKFRPRLRLAGWYQRDNKFICDICKNYLENLNYYVHVGTRRGVLAVPMERMF